MKRPNKFIMFKKLYALEKADADAILLQTTLFHGDIINLISEASMNDELSMRDSVELITDFLLLIAKIDVTFKQKNKQWWNGEVILNKKSSNLIVASRLMTRACALMIVDDLQTRRKSTDLLQEAIEIVAEILQIDIRTLLEDVVVTHNDATSLIEEEFKTEGTFIMDLITDNKGKYDGILLDKITFNTGVINMDFFKASTHAVVKNKNYGIKISDNLKNYIEDTEEYYEIKFFNAADTADNAFYTLKTEGTSNKLFKGDEDVTDKISIIKNGITLIPFVDFSMVLATEKMETLDDLLDYFTEKQNKK